MIETHNMWSPFHYSYVSEDNPPRTYYIVVEDSELEAWETTQRTTLTLSEWKSTTSKVFQHLHLHEHPLEALNYIIALIHNSMSTTIPPWNERLHLIALNLYPRTTVERHLMEYYQREGSDYKELENHSNTLQEMNQLSNEGRRRRRKTDKEKKKNNRNTKKGKRKKRMKKTRTLKCEEEDEKGRREEKEKGRRRRKKKRRRKKTIKKKKKKNKKKKKQKKTKYEKL